LKRFFSRKFETRRSISRFTDTHREEEFTMVKALLALGAAVILTAAPAAAEKHYSNYITCSKVKDGSCVTWKRLTRGAAARAYASGYVFGPKYEYTPFPLLPPDYVTRYSLTPDGRYVYKDGYIYVVDPTTYAVTRVIDVLGG
jgi:hypothetical protein